MATFTTWQPHNDLSDSRLKSHHPSRRARVVKHVAPPFLSLETILLDMFFYPLIQTSCFFVLVIFRLRNKLCKDRNAQLSSVSHIKKRESDNKKYLSNSQAFFFLPFHLIWPSSVQAHKHVGWCCSSTADHSLRISSRCQAEKRAY